MTQAELTKEWSPEVPEGFSPLQGDQYAQPYYRQTEDGWEYAFFSIYGAQYAKDGIITKGKLSK